MRRRELLAAPGALVIAAAGETPAPSPPNTNADNRLDAALRPYLAQYGLPAVAAAAVRDGRLVAAGAVGTRRIDSDIPVTINDRFHIGSDTKAMTALLAAMLVEAGKLRWDATVGAIFPELAATMAPGVAGITLEQLLSHTSGISSGNPAQDKLIEQSFAQPGNLDELRYWIVTGLVKEPMQSKPGENFAYSNLGYTLAGAIIERLGGKTWEELIAERIFDPLGLKTAGFGPQSSLSRVDAPLGHRTLPDGRLKAMLAGPNGDNPEVIGPAGTVHLSVLDFATWAGWQTGSGKRGPALIHPETFAKLHAMVIEMPIKPDAAVGTPSRGRYGLGIGEITLPFSPEPFLFHGGSNEMNLAYIMMQPKYNFAMVTMTNRGGNKADDALKSLSAALYQEFGPATARPSGATPAGQQSR
ncbi:MAG: serine hydrolase domain-containing protein [Stellaceae bacterium]